MAESADVPGRWGEYDSQAGRPEGRPVPAGTPPVSHGAPSPKVNPAPEIPPKDPFPVWSTCGMLLFIVGAIAAVVYFANSGGTESSGYGLSRTTVDVVYMDVLAGAVCSTVLSAAGLIVAVVAKVGSHIQTLRVV